MLEMAKHLGFSILPSREDSTILLLSKTL